MKKISILFAVAILLVLSSCTTTHHLVSQSAYNRENYRVAVQLESKGYKASGKSHDTQNEIVVTGQSYSTYTGYGTEMSNSYNQYDTYRFSDTEGNTVEYNVKYKYIEDCLTDIQVLGCSTSKASDYMSVCEGDMSPQMIVGNITPDREKEIYDSAKTYCLIGVLGLLASLLSLMAI